MFRSPFPSSAEPDKENAMHPQHKRYQAVATWATFMLGVGMVTLGCNRSKPEESPASQGEPKPQETKVIPAKAAGPAVSTWRNLPPFTDATLQEPPDEDQFLPPDKTLAGASVGKLYEQIAGHDGAPGLWDKVVFQRPDGTRIRYQAVLTTDLGTITIDLWPDVAPNHVRNFVALIKAGYYKGLYFDRTVKEPIEGLKDSFVELVEAGCPLGTGEPGYGSIGYWLKPELSDKAHEEGTVGACHGETLESAAAKFYINLNKAPGMDGNWTIFGKVSQGIEVVRAIFQRPMQNEFFRPRDPVMIRDATVVTRP
jgi:peptidyl-prolyl cis-trans isomerase B (cyclophilin B)